MKTSCETIKDLLPLYYDNVCSAESRAVVEEHIGRCPDCEKHLGDISAEIKQPSVNKADEEKPIRAMRSAWKKARTCAFAAGCVIAALTIVILALNLRVVTIGNAFESSYSYYPEGDYDG